MDEYTDKRACERFRHTAIIKFSYFNKQRWYEVQMLNYCDEGICFKSEIPLQTPATVVIRLKCFSPPGAYRFRYGLDKNQWENETEADKFVPSPYGDSDNSVIIV